MVKHTTDGLGSPTTSIPPLHQPTMRSPSSTATSSPASSITVPTTPATSHHQLERDDTPNRLPENPPVSTNDFYLDTFFSPVWMSGPHVFSFAEDGTVVRPQTYAMEPYPGYHADRARRLEPTSVNPTSATASHCQGFSGVDPKPWKNVAITEQDDAEFAAFKERMRVGELGERQQQPPHANVQYPVPEEPELVYTWPPKTNGW